jgi:hypothetical protein
MLTLPRKYLIVPLLVMCLAMPVGPCVVVGGTHFYVARIMTLAGLIRVLTSRGSWRVDELTGGYNSIDRAFVWCALTQALATTLLFLEMPALINQIGALVDVLGVYLLARMFITSDAEVRRAIKCLAVLVAIFGVCMVVEQYKMFNSFSVFGGRLVPEVRDEKIRSQGPFSHALLAGTFGAVLLPIFGILWAKGGSKVAAMLGMAGSTAMTLAAHSSTPLSAYGAGIIGLLFWPLRGRMRMVRWGIVAFLAVTALFMKAPIWFILAHVDLTGSSSGYHRAEVIDQCYHHFRDWWLMGVKDTGAWGWGLWDVQDQYVSIAESGGLLPLVLFITLITRAFAQLGKARKAAGTDRSKQWLLWCLGSVTFGHLVGFFGVNYFDQSKIGWFVLLAMISAVTVPLLAPATVKAKARVTAPALELAYQTQVESAPQLR